MKTDVYVETIGEQLGSEGVGSIVSNAEAYCACAVRRIKLANEPGIVALQAEGKLLLDEGKNLAERLRFEPPPGDIRSRRHRTAYYLAVTALLTVAGFVFSVYSLEPFRFGLKAYLYCLGVAIAVPFLVDFTIVRLKSEALIKGLALSACLAGLLSLILLAAIRGDLMAEGIKDSAPVITFDDAPTPSAPAQNMFYDRAIPLLQLVMILLALAMELGTGLAMYEAWRLSSCITEDWPQLRKRLKEIHQRMGVLTFEITALKNEPQAFCEDFWKDFYRAMFSRGMRSAMTKVFLAVLALLCFVHGVAVAQAKTETVIAVDLSRSVDVRGPDAKTEFQKNIEAVTRQLAQFPSDSRVTIIGITNHSFTEPDILLRATIPADAGYFGEHLKAARRQLVRSWQARIRNVAPCYGSTDITGAMQLAAQIFEKHANSGTMVLMIYSDMRQSTESLDLEQLATVPPFSQIRFAYKEPVADLHNVHVFVMGVDGSGKSMKYWQTLRDYWAQYFVTIGADLESYSIVRDSISLR